MNPPMCGVYLYFNILCGINQGAIDYLDDGDTLLFGNKPSEENTATVRTVFVLTV